MNPYQKLLSKKRSWEPVMPTKGKLAEGSEETIFRALALRNLELPVGDFITNALDTEVPDTARELYSQISRTKLSMTSLWVTSPLLTALMRRRNGKLNPHKRQEDHDHTILKAMVAERALFFVFSLFALTQTLV